MGKIIIAWIVLLNLSVLGQTPPPSPIHGGTNGVITPTDYIAPYVYPTNAVLKWSVVLPAQSSAAPYGTPMVCPNGNIVVAGSHNVNDGGASPLVMYNSTGTLVWRDYLWNYTIPRETVLGTANIYLLASYVLTSNTSGPDQNASLWSLNPTNGVPLWKCSLGGSFANWDYSGSHPIGTDGTIYVPWFSAVVAITNGSVKWTYSGDNRGGQTFIDMFSGHQPSIGPDGVIYISGSSIGDYYHVYSQPGLQAINPDGTRRWLIPSDSVWYDKNDFGDPIVGNGCLYLTDSKKRLYSITFQGTTNWVYTGTTFTQVPEIGMDGTIYAETVNGLAALTQSGKLKWIFPSTTTHCAIASDNEIFVANTSNLYSLKPDGSLNWTYALNADTVGNPVLSTDGSLYLVINRQSDTSATLLSFVAPNIACGTWPEYLLNSRHTGAKLKMGTVYPGTMTTNGYQFPMSGPTNYPVCPCASSDFGIWTNLGSVINQAGRTTVTDKNAHSIPRRFYIASPQ